MPDPTPQILEEEMMTNVIYVFDCPYHGKQSQVFCFRAFEKKNRGRWKRLEVQNKEVPLSDEDLNAFLNGMKGA